MKMAKITIYIITKRILYFSCVAISAFQFNYALRASVKRGVNAAEMWPH